MLKIPMEKLQDYESDHPGITEQIWDFENAILPACSLCGSEDTADVQVGIIGRTIYIHSATTKFHLTPNGPKKGRYFCNSCRSYFTPSAGGEPIQHNKK
jgi:hypothetical protein